MATRFDGRAFGEKLFMATKDFVERKVAMLAQDLIAQGKRQSSADQLLDDLSKRVEALEAREAAQSAQSAQP